MDETPDFVVPKRLCKGCSKAFYPTHPRMKYCSPSCGNSYWNEHNGVKSRYPGLPTATVGAIGEMQVCADLLAKGYEVFRAVSASCSCDIAILKNDKMLRVEARTGYRSKNGKVFYAKKVVDAGRSDHFAIIVSPTEIVYIPELPPIAGE